MGVPAAIIKLPAVLRAMQRGVFQACRPPPQRDHRASFWAPCPSSLRSQKVGFWECAMGIAS